MRPVHQTRHGWPDGNCLMACVASVMELPLEACPDLGSADGEEGHADWGIMRAFAQDRGYALCWWDGRPPAGYSIVSLMQPNGIPHACVALDGTIVHNPVQGAPLEFPATVRGYVAFVLLAPASAPGGSKEEDSDG